MNWCSLPSCSYVSVCLAPLFYLLFWLLVRVDCIVSDPQRVLLSIVLFATTERFIQWTPEAERNRACILANGY